MGQVDAAHVTESTSPSSPLDSPQSLWALLLGVTTSIISEPAPPPLDIPSVQGSFVTFPPVPNLAARLGCWSKEKFGRLTLSPLTLAKACIFLFLHCVGRLASSTTFRLPLTSGAGRFALNLGRFTSFAPGACFVFFGGLRDRCTMGSTLCTLHWFHATPHAHLCQPHLA